MRIVTLPIGATEDRVVGSLDIEQAIKLGVRALEPGILAEANQNVLYIDEVNLLPDHITDDILDSAASGWNIVEREAISIGHPARFVLVGTMNPEEGELRPQLMDRFGLHVQLENNRDEAARVEIIRRCIEFSEEPDIFAMKYEAEEERICQTIAKARESVSKVVVPLAILESIAAIHLKLQVDGYRPDIVAVRTAKAHAAYKGRLEVGPEDVKVALELTLTHRTRKSGLRNAPSMDEIRAAIKSRAGIKKTVRKLDLRKPRARTPRDVGPGRTINLLTSIFVIVPAIILLIISYQRFGLFLSESPWLAAMMILAVAVLGSLLGGRMRRGSGPMQVRLLDLSRIATVQGRVSQVVVEDSEGNIRTPSVADIQKEKNLALEAMRNELSALKDFPKDSDSLRPPKFPRKEGRARKGTQYLVGKRAKVVTSSAKGRYTYYQLPKKKPWDVAFVPTLRAASLFQNRRRTDNQHAGGQMSVLVKSDDVRVKVREYRAPFSIVLLVDMSFSMAASLVNIGRAIFSLHRSVYRRRDRVSLIVFKGKDAVVLQQPTTNLEMVVGKLRKVGTSDFTPMATGLLRAWRLLRLEKQRNSDAVPILIVVSDGIVNVPLSQPLSTSSRKQYMGEPQADVMDMAHILRRDGIRVIVINTSHRKSELPGDVFKKITSTLEWFTPTELMLQLAQITDGSYYGLSLSSERLGNIRKSRLDDWFYFDDK
jgi:Mg-chelatase subunit ChlD/MoxR-like ATPase